MTDMNETPEEEVEDYFADNASAEDLQEEYNDWLKEYEISDFLENTEENWAKVQAMDTHMVWTDHGTCENPQVTSGARMYSGRCCWDTYGWHIAKKPWEGDDQTFLAVLVGSYLPCHVCNRTGEEEDENECETCEGERWINHFFD